MGIRNNVRIANVWIPFSSELIYCCEESNQPALPLPVGAVLFALPSCFFFRPDQRRSAVETWPSSQQYTSAIHHVFQVNQLERKTKTKRSRRRIFLTISFRWQLPIARIESDLLLRTVRRRRARIVSSANEAHSSTSVSHTHCVIHSNRSTPYLAPVEGIVSNDEKDKQIVSATYGWTSSPPWSNMIEKTRPRCLSTMSKIRFIHVHLASSEARKRSRDILSRADDSLLLATGDEDILTSQFSSDDSPI